MSSLTKEEYSIKEFAELMKLDEEYVRQCCRGYTNAKGTKAKLPDEFYCIPPKGWILKPKISPLISKRIEGSNYWEDPITKPIKDLETYKNFDQRKCNFMDIIIVKNHQKNIVLYNIIEHLKEPVRDIKFFLGDYLLFLLVKFLGDPQLGANHSEDGCRAFLLYFNLLKAWFNKAGIKITFDGEPFVPAGNFCWYCGRPIRYKKEKGLVIGAQFCKSGHASAFYQETWRKTKSGGAYISSEPIHWKLKRIQSETNKLGSNDALLAFKNECSGLVKFLAQNIIEKYLEENHNNIAELDRHIGDVKMSVVEEHFTEMNLESWINNGLISPGIDKKPYKTLDRLLSNSSYCLHEDNFRKYFYKVFGETKGIKHRIESYLKNESFKVKIHLLFLINLKK